MVYFVTRGFFVESPSSCSALLTCSKTAKGNGEKVGVNSTQILVSLHSCMSCRRFATLTNHQRPQAEQLLVGKHLFFSHFSRWNAPTTHYDTTFANSFTLGPRLYGDLELVLAHSDVCPVVRREARIFHFPNFPQKLLSLSLSRSKVIRELARC